MADKVQSVIILPDAIATGIAPEFFTPETSKITFHATGETSAGAGTADVEIQVSNEPGDNADKNWLVSATISLVLGTTKVGDGFVSAAAWKHVRAEVTALTGTDATVRCYMGRSGAE